MSLFQFIKSKTFIKQVLIAAAATIVLFFVIEKWLDITTNHNQKIEVPDLQKMQLNQVERMLKNIDLNFLVIDSASFNPDFPKNSVIDQSPLAGSFVKEGRKIYLTLNASGYKTIEVPDLLGKTKRQAVSELTAVGFRVSDEAIYVSDIALDVIRGMLFNDKELSVGEKIPKNSIITLKLGDGKAGEVEKIIEEVEAEN